MKQKAFTENTWHEDMCDFDALSGNDDQNDDITLIPMHHQDKPLQSWLTSETIIRM